MSELVIRILGEDRHHRIAAGGRMVRSEDHRLTSRRDLDRAADQWLAGQFGASAVSGPDELPSSQPHADPIGLCTAPPFAKDRFRCFEPIQPWPGKHRQPDRLIHRGLARTGQWRSCFRPVIRAEGR